MTIYLLNIILLLIWGYYLIYSHPTENNKIRFCVIASFQWTLVSGLRGNSVGADTVGYIRMFDKVGTSSWKEILHAFVEVYFQGRTPRISIENFLYKDTGYLVFQKIVHIFTDNAQVYLFIVAMIIFASLAYFVYKNSEDPVFSYILFSALFYSFYAITGLRQALATALIVFVGFEFIKNRKMWKFFIIALIAFILHKSAIIFIPFYFLATKKITWKYIGILSGITVFFLIMGERFILLTAVLLGYNRDAVYVADTSNYTMIMTLVGIAIILLFEKIQNKDMEINATLLAVSLTLLTLIDQSMMRVQQYYALFLMFSIPSLLNCFEKKSRNILRIGCIFVLILYLIRNNPQYMFFWQSNY